ncbi:hypothetical protein LH464_02380 [Neorhizobium sp. T786]|uniref:hypothetical protein n=1 Tax=Pseudorhizobium xiangyangii TaxID=2883104 RepID=UPI001CFF82AB|nr:hypothetical protein [Neorhizobium xiangyangii]MCB5201324.1 hypothetical protein [Neorhizobium xiangyangii]
MNALNSMPVPRQYPSERGSERSRLTDSHDMIEHLADELRSRSDPCLPREFYIEQVKRQLAARSGAPGTARDQADPKNTLQSASVFQAWALRE